MGNRAIKQLLNMANNFSMKGEKIRHHRLGAVGIRSDGVVVVARNSPVQQRMPQAHAEARLAKKLTPGSIVFVCRKNKVNGDNALAKPCPDCVRVLRSVGVSKVYYTTDDGFESMEF
jgi:tRNA(Arg) A34 adenosine deaminase TadA